MAIFHQALPQTDVERGKGRVPNDLMASYYTQRATAGLIISEATSVTPMGVGYPDTPGIWSKAQVEGWKRVTHAVHKAGGRMVLQSSTNQRTDDYGGCKEHRARLLLDVTDAVIAVWGTGRVGVHLAPRGDAHDMGDNHPAATFDYVAEALGKRNAVVGAGCGRCSGFWQSIH